MKWMRGAMACAAVSLCACAGNGEGLDENGRPPQGDGSTLQPTFASIQANVLTPLCTGCHAGAAAPLGLRLDEGASYALLVNAPSVEVSGLDRVEPGNPDASYLIQKLEGTAAVGARMPLNQPPVPPEVIAAIRQWIAAGALADAGASALKANDARSFTGIAPQAGETLRAPPAAIVIGTNAILDQALLQAGLIALRASGGDLSFAEGNEVAIPFDLAVRSVDPTVLALTPQLPAWPADTYELRIGGSAPVASADVGGVLMDGDGDGVPGGDFVLQFSVENER